MLERPWFFPLFSRDEPPCLSSSFPLHLHHTSSQSICQQQWPNVLCGQLKPVAIPTFKEDKGSFPAWKVAFIACVDQAPVIKEYKLSQLRSYLCGHALSVFFLPNIPCVHVRKLGTSIRRSKMKSYLQNLQNLYQCRSGQTSRSFVIQRIDIRDRSHVFCLVASLVHACDRYRGMGFWQF